MAIIRPSAKFEGSELGLNSGKAPYLPDAVRRVEFTKTANQEGAWLFFLPAYAQDRNGAGLWYKKISIRADFGTNYREKYYVPNLDNDPAEYFSKACKLLFPDIAAIGKEINNGKEFKKYPAFGRVAQRVLYNVAYAAKLEAGAHVLDLPLRNGADNLMNWIEGKDITGQPRPMINDPDRALSVFVKLKDNSQNPWQVQVESSQAIALPIQLADSDYLYNLDNVLVVKPAEEIIAKLREMYQGHVFDDCMEGYPGLTRTSVPGGYPTTAVPFNPPAPQAAMPPVPQAPVMEIARPFNPAQQAAAPVYQQPAPAADQVPMYHAPQTAAAPVAMPPQMMTASAVQVPTAIVNPPPAIDMGALPRNPMAGGRMSREEAQKFMTGGN